MKPLDYSLYNKVKEKFPPQIGKVVFVSLASENLEELKGRVFELETRAELGALVDNYAKDATPFATIGSFESKEPLIFFASSEFEQEQNLVTGEILLFAVGEYNNNPVDIKALKEEMLRLSAGLILSGNA